MKLGTILLACFITAACNSGPPISPLIAASREGDAARIAELVKSGADVNQRGGVNNWTPLMHAVHKRQLASVRALLDAGADVNATAGARGRDTALRLADSEGYSDIAATLREHGARTLK
ncbi:MAG: ankyrin repeat domain-containing protein [Bryobacteraceae bacterium]|jgi:ankyrin repeat protein